MLVSFVANLESGCKLREWTKKLFRIEGQNSYLFLQQMMYYLGAKCIDWRLIEVPDSWKYVLEAGWQAKGPCMKTSVIKMVLTILPRLDWMAYVTWFGTKTCYSET